MELTVFFLSDMKSRELKVSLQAKVMVIPYILTATPGAGKTGSSGSPEDQDSE